MNTTMNHKFGHFFWIAVVIALSLGSCNDTPVDPDRSCFRITPETVVIWEDKMESELLSRSGNTLVFRTGDSLIDNLKAGNVIVTDSGKGLIRRIDKISRSNREVILKTSQAALTDAIEEGRLTYRQSVNEKTIKRIEQGKHTKLIKQKGLKKQYEEYDYEIGVEFNDENIGLEIVGSVYFNMDWELDALIESSEMKEFQCGLFGKIETDLSVTATLKKDLIDQEFRIPFANVYLNPVTVMAGPVPVVFVPVISFYLTAEGNVYAGFKPTFSAAYDFTAGIKYNYGEAGSYNESNIENDFKPFQPTAGVNFQLGFGPRLSVLIYGVLGPYIHVEVFNELDIDIFSKPEATLYGGIEASGGASIDILGVIQLARFEIPVVMDVKETLWTSPYIESISPVTVSPNESITIEGIGFGDRSTLNCLFFGEKRISSSKARVWNNSRISVEVPENVSSCKLAASIMGVRSNEVELIIRNDDVIIKEIEPDQARHNEIIKIIGKNFGSRTQNSKVEFSGNVIGNELISWSDSEIDVRVPDDAVSGNVFVHKSNTMKSNGKHLEIISGGGGDSNNKLILTVSPSGQIERKVGESYTYTLKVTDQAGKKLSGASILVDDKVAGTGSTLYTNSYGETAYSEVVPDWQSAGTHSISFKVSKADYKSCPEVDRRIKVLKEHPPCSLSLSVSPSGKNYLKPGGRYSYSLSVKDNLGKPVSNATVGIYDEVSGSASELRTNGSGTAEYTRYIPEGKSAGQYDVRFRASKTGCNSTSWVERQIEVEKGSCKIKRSGFNMDKKKYKAGENVVGKAFVEIDGDCDFVYEWGYETPNSSVRWVKKVTKRVYPMTLQLNSLEDGCHFPSNSPGTYRIHLKFIDPANGSMSTQYTVE